MFHRVLAAIMAMYKTAEVTEEEVCLLPTLRIPSSEWGVWLSPLWCPQKEGRDKLL